MKHVKLFEGFEEDSQEGSEETSSRTPWTETIEIPEGYVIDFYRPDNEEDLMAYYERAGVQDWSELTYDEWKETVSEMGEQTYDDGTQFFRGRISWEPNGNLYELRDSPNIIT